MILKRQSVQSFSDHKAARTFCLSQERGIFEQMVWSGTKRSFFSCLEQMGGSGGGGAGAGGERVRLGKIGRASCRERV